MHSDFNDLAFYINEVAFREVGLSRMNTGRGRRRPENGEEWYEVQLRLQ